MFRKWFIRVGRVIVIVYVLICLVVAGCQKTLIFPGHAWQGSPRAALPSDVGGETIHRKTALGADIVLWYGSAQDATGQPLADAMNRPTIIYFNGNGTLLTWSVPMLNRWRRLGVNTLGVEHPGYGLSGGEPGENEFYAAADSAYDEIARRTPNSKIISAGQSLGTGVAVDLASRKPVGGLALFAPFTSMNAMAHHSYPWLPTGLFLQYHFRSDQKIGSIACPMLIVRGSHDSIVPPTQSKELADAAKRATSVELILVDSDHNDLFLRAGAEIDAALRRLIAKVK